MLKWIKKLLRKKHKLADFSQLEPNQQVPTPSGRSVDGLGLTNPDSVLSGTNRGTQFVGSASLQVDSTQNLITVKGSNAVNANNVLRFGQVANNYLGMAVNNGTVDTMFAGQDSSGSTVVKIAKTGYDAKTATNDQLIFNSSQDTFKIVVSSTASQSVSSLAQDATNTLTVSHNLGYIPAAIVYLNGTGSNYLTTGRYYVPPVPVPVKVGATYYPGIIHTYSIDATNIYFMVTNSSAATPITDIGTVNWKYYLLQESAS